MSPEQIRAVWLKNSKKDNETLRQWFIRNNVPINQDNAQLVFYVFPWLGMIHAEAVMTKLEQIYWRHCYWGA